MADLTTLYLGKELRNPVIVGASGLSADMKTIQELDRLGVGALVLKSLFEEQIQLELAKFDEEKHRYDDLHAMMTTVGADVEYHGVDEHIMWVRRAKEACSMPVFASLNAVHRDTWVEYARKLADTGVDGLELNFYNLPTDPSVTANELEDGYIETLKAIKATVACPLSVKLSPFHTNPLNMAQRIDEIGVNGLVLFNRLFQPDMDIRNEKPTFPFNLSDPRDARLPLRYMGLLYENVHADLCAATGIFGGRDVVKMLLAGATCVQVTSTLYRHRIAHLTAILDDLQRWMDEKGYARLQDFRGKMSCKNSPDRWAYKRAQYVGALLRANPLSDGESG